MKKEIKTVSAESFRDKNGYYIFPFEVMDKTPGGSNLGRIEWCMEPIRSKRKRRGGYFIEKLLVWAKQTRDERYRGKIFEIPTYAEALCGDSLRHQAYLNHVWYMGFCADHGGTFMMAYPENNHSLLKINAGSSISIDAVFE